MPYLISIRKSTHLIVPVRVVYMHCPNHNLYLRAKTEPIPAGADATVYVLVSGPDILYSM